MRRAALSNQSIVPRGIEDAPDAELAAAHLAAIRACAELRTSALGLQAPLAGALAEHFSSARPNGLEATIAYLKTELLDGLQLYLEDLVNTEHMAIHAIRRYRLGVQAFDREICRALAEGAGKQKEVALQRHIHRYLFDTNIDFTIEPATAEGYPDVVLRIPSGHLVIDAKYLKDPSLGKVRDSIAKGLHQVSRYCDAFAENWGVLVVFQNIEPRPVVVGTGGGPADYVEMQGKRIYVLVVDIFDRPTASKVDTGQQIMLPIAELVVTAE